ncbi:unnamed protein product [Allacma fusca]|uniref:Uncharacterized protein n=1 Tax=Allacma fusca TaxID=39272 RepID=A0A8J2PNL9_9HEXA|nr:unnamed protein product [Allacma fusca]
MSAGVLQVHSSANSTVFDTEAQEKLGGTRRILRRMGVRMLKGRSNCRDGPRLYRGRKVAEGNRSKLKDWISRNCPTLLRLKT